MPGMTGASTVLVENIMINPGKKHTYTINMQYKYGDYSQDANQGKTFAATFQLSASNTTATTNPTGGVTYTYPAS